jgi:hypothetical protein
MDYHYRTKEPLMNSHLRIGAFLAFLVLLVSGIAAQARQKPEIPTGSKVYIAPMDGFETYLGEAFSKKKVPLEVVNDKSQADFVIKGNAASQKAGLAKKLIFGSWHSDEDASITVTNLKTGEVVYAYAVHKQNSAHGERSTAEACAKHLKTIIEAN